MMRQYELVERVQRSPAGKADYRWANEVARTAHSVI